MCVPVKFSDTPPCYSGYWPVIDPDTGTLKHLVSVKSGRMYLCTSIPENTLPARFFLCDSYDSEWAGASLLTDKPNYFIKSYLFKYWCIFFTHKGRLSICNGEKIYPLYWRRTSMAELELLDLF